MDGNPPAQPLLRSDGFDPSRHALHAGLEQFSAVSSIFDAAEMVLYVADMQTYELLFMNTEAQRHWGRSRIGERCHEVLQAGQAGPCEFCTNSRLIEKGQAAHPVVWEFQNTVNGRWYLCIDKAIPWSDGRLVRMEVAIDVTDRKQHEEFRDQYVGLISHDLRTPLLTINLSAATLKLQMERGDLAKAAEPLEAIRHSTKRMSEMIEDLLETTRLESGQLQLHKSPVDLEALANTVARELGATQSHRIRCEAKGPAVVVADAGRVERVLENLVSNAIRYSPAGGQVTIGVAAAATETIVTVTDQGAGIPADVVPKLFQRFYRAGPGDASNGLGLGLYNSRLIVEHHGGRIWVKSAPGTGSTFGFSLPAAQREAPPT
ncbi:MAG: HAMP domain-containing sensor histidine kinase [Ramlibacter sp.]|nr:HAMP domain-containing sensor histidine kinase [Ramlibacter sp.]